MNETGLQRKNDKEMLQRAVIVELCDRGFGRNSVSIIRDVTNGYGHECFLVCCDGKKFLIKINIRHTKKSDVQNEICACNILKSVVPVPTIYGDGDFNEGKRFYYIQEYIEGNDASEVVKKMSPKEKAHFFEEFGESTGKMHSVPGSFYSEDLLGLRKHDSFHTYCEQRLKRSLDACDRARLVPHMKKEEVIKKIEKVKSYITSKSVPCFNHGDLHLGNLICDDSCELASIIDFESSKFTDVSFDFVKMKLWIFAEHERYYTDFMRGYQRIKKTSNDFDLRLDLSMGIEIIHFIDYFGSVFPNEEMYAFFMKELEKWLDK